MRSRRGPRSRRWAVALVPLLVGACAASTATEISIADQQPGTTVSGAQPSSASAAEPALGTPTTVSATTVDSTTTTSTLPPDCVGLPGMSSEDKTYEHDDVERTYKLALPVGYDGTRFAPMIINFHGHGGSAAQHDTNTSMSKIASKRGYIVVTPNAVNQPPSWNVRRDPDRDDDFEFIHGLIDELKTTLCVDVNRIFATGHSNGGVFAATLVCSEPYEFSAFAMVSAGSLAYCAQEVQPAMLSIAGTADETYPYEDDSGKDEGAVDVVNSWAVQDDCADEPTIKELVDGVQQMAFVDCAKGDVVLLTIVDGAHPWPGGAVAADLEENSEAGKTFSATDAILDFFEGHLGA